VYLTLPIWIKLRKQYTFIGENVLSAGNQQERLDAAWITGFVDGEGCFYVGINRINKMSLGWQVLPEFRIVQHQRDEQVLQKIMSHFGFGSIRVNHGDRKEFRVRGLENLNKIIGFFRKHPLQSKKKKDFELFSEIIGMMNQKEHLTKSGLNRIAKLASNMNEKVKSQYLVSSETIRRTSQTQSNKQ